MKRGVDVIYSVEDVGWGDVGAKVLLTQNDEILGNVFVCFDKYDIEDIVKKNLEEMSENELENAIAIRTLQDFDKLLERPKLSKAYYEVKRLYDSVDGSDNGFGSIELKSEDNFIKDCITYDSFGTLEAYEEWHNGFIQDGVATADYEFMLWFIDDRNPKEEDEIVKCTVARIMNDLKKLHVDKLTDEMIEDIRSRGILCNDEIIERVNEHLGVGSKLTKYHEKRISKEELLKIYGVSAKCPICHSRLIKSDLAEYDYLCVDCDEYFSTLEV